MGRAVSSRAASARIQLSLLLLACVYTLYFAAELLVPLTVSLLLALMLTPLVRSLHTAYVPRPLAAVSVVLVVLTVFGVAGNLMWAPAGEWLSAAPEKLQALEPRLRELRAPLDEIRNASETIVNAADGEAEEQTVAVELEGETFLESLAAESPRMLASLLGIIFLLYFLLAYGDQVLKKIERLSARRSPGYAVTEIVVTIQRQISRYLLIITVVNTVVAGVVALGLWAVGFPNPILWGSVAGLLNYAPYVGAAVTAVLLGVVGLLSLDSVGMALAVPAVFMVITALEGQLLTPTLLGRQLAISPYMVFLSITFWGWLWGIVGALIAVPILVILKIVAESVPSMGWLATLLDRDRDYATPAPPAADPEDSPALP